jgi:DNA-3-methyladenine glycosylase II
VAQQFAPPTADDAGSELRRHLTILRRRDPHLSRALKEIGFPGPRKVVPGFAALARIIIDQQVSTAAGAAIWAKLTKACNGKVTPRRILALSEPALRACGLSGQKVRYVVGLADAVNSKALDLDALESADDATVRAALTALKGIGNWTADIYLMFAMGRTDIWPVADLALQHGVRMLRGHPAKPTAKEMEVLAELWRPYRSCAAIFLWHYYAAQRKKAAE